MTFEELSAFLQQDPDNVPLRLDCAQAALNEDAHDIASDLLKPLVEAKNETATGLYGLILLRQQDYEAALACFTALNTDKPDDPAIAFNLAWARANLKLFEEALAVLDDITASAFPQAATLKVQLQHQLGQFEEAVLSATALLELFPEDTALLAAVSTVAMDIGNAEWALELASQAADNPDAKVTLGSLALQRGDVDTASRHFDEVLLGNNTAPRALIGKGLCHMLSGEQSDAAHYLDQGAELFSTHLGSWIAAGWSHVTQGDRATARDRFETALSIDDTFSEIHGSLGVLDMLEGDTVSAWKRIRTAKRLDPNCASAALGTVLLLEASERPDTAKAVFKTALQTPIDDQGTTLGQAMARIGLS